MSKTPGHKAAGCRSLPGNDREQRPHPGGELTRSLPVGVQGERERQAPQNTPTEPAPAALSAPWGRTGETPRSRRALVVLALAAVAGLVDLGSIATAEARDWASLSGLPQASDLHVCEAVPQSSPSREGWRAEAVSPIGDIRPIGLTEAVLPMGNIQVRR